MEATKKEITVVTKKEFITMWKAASNNVKRKPTYKKEEIKVYSHETKRYETITHKVKVKGFLYPEHHILYNIVRGKPLSRGFGEYTDGYLSALGFFTAKNPSKYFIDVLYEAFKDGMTKEQFDALIVEAHEIAIS